MNYLEPLADRFDESRQERYRFASRALAYLLGQLMTSQLYGITSMDPLVLLLVTATLSGAALLASVVPAWRASRIDPIVALSR